MKEFNELTKRLLIEGYDAENHPDYVEVGKSCRDKDNPLRNFEGGFRYFSWYIYEKAFRTPCGLMCKGISCITSLCYNNTEWSFENDLATIHCPYRKLYCEKKDHRLPKDGVLKDLCNVHLTDEVYVYEGSVECITKKYEERIKREKISFSLQMNGRVCDMHMRYNRSEEKWEMKYNPETCARFRCTGNLGSKGGTNICPVLGRPLDKNKGNVYYDLKKAYRRKDLDGTLFDGQIDTSITKGIRVFDHPVSMDICRNYVKLCKDEIIWKMNMKYHTELFFAERYDRHEFSVEVLNIRAEQKESRDLMQDLQDIQDGIKVMHDSDEKKMKKTEKSEKRQKTLDKKIAKIEKQILNVGFSNLGYREGKSAMKYLSENRIEELEKERERREQEKAKAPVQMSIEDFLK